MSDENGIISKFFNHDAHVFDDNYDARMLYDAPSQPHMHGQRSRRKHHTHYATPHYATHMISASESSEENGIISKLFNHGTRVFVDKHDARMLYYAPSQPHMHGQRPR